MHGTLEHPHYTRPAVFRGWSAPDVLLNGNHADIARWRREQSELLTTRRRVQRAEQLRLERARELNEPDAPAQLENTDKGQTTNDEGPTPQIRP